MHKQGAVNEWPGDALATRSPGPTPKCCTTAHGPAELPPTYELLVHFKWRLHIRLCHRLPLLNHLRGSSSSSSTAAAGGAGMWGNAAAAVRILPPRPPNNSGPQQPLGYQLVLRRRQQRKTTYYTPHPAAVDYQAGGRTWKASSSCATRIWLPYCAACICR